MRVVLGAKPETFTREKAMTTLEALVIDDENVMPVVQDITYHTDIDGFAAVDKVSWPRL